MTHLIDRIKLNSINSCTQEDLLDLCINEIQHSGRMIKKIRYNR